jgi:hypothetical protein
VNQVGQGVIFAAEGRGVEQSHPSEVRFGLTHEPGESQSIFRPFPHPVPGTRSGPERLPDQVGPAEDNRQPPRDALLSHFGDPVRRLLVNRLRV